MTSKALILDIDGTLTNSQKEITPATKAAIQELLKRGEKVILASGRPTPGMRRYEEELELQKYGGYLLSFNGVALIRAGMEPLRPTYLTRSASIAAASAAAAISFRLSAFAFSSSARVIIHLKFRKLYHKSADEVRVD